MTREDYIDRRSDAEARLLGLLKQADLRVKQAYLAGDAEGERAARELFERLDGAARLFDGGALAEVERLKAQLAAARPVLELEALRAGRFSVGKVSFLAHLCKADEPGGCAVCGPTIARPTRDDAPAADLTGFFEEGALLEVDDAPCKCSSCAEERGA